LSISTLSSAFLKSLIWVTFGCLKNALPMIISHTIGLTVLTQILIIKLCRNDNISRKILKSENGSNASTEEDEE